MSEVIQAYYFATKERQLRYNDNRLIVLNETHEINVDPICCNIGLHGSINILDALTYAPGPILYKVELFGKFDKQKDKIAATKRKYIAELDATNVLRHFAKQQALINIYKIKPYCTENEYNIILNYLNGNNEVESARSASWSAAESAKSAAELAAESAAWSARSASWSAAESAAESIARSASWSAAWSARSAAESAAESAAWSAWSARSASWSAAESAARSAAESAAWSAAESAAWSAARSAAESAAWSAAELMLIDLISKEQWKTI